MGEIPAAINVDVDHPDVEHLIPNAEAAGFDALSTQGHYPINHTVVVKDELLAAYRDLAPDIFRTFVQAKQHYVDRLKANQIAAPTKVDRMHRRVLEITGSDPLPYGIEPNRKMINAVIQYAREQGILARSFSMEELFAPGTLAL